MSDVDAAPATAEALGGVSSPTVADVRCRVFRARSSDAVAMSFGPMSHRAMFVVEVELDDGTIGRGESWVNYPSWAWRERLATVQHGLRPLLVGAEASDPSRVHGEMLARLLPLGRQWGAPGPLWQALSGADVALWDALARRQGLPLVDVLGGRRHAVLLAYGSSLGPTDVVRTAERCGALGLRAVKIKVGFGRERDLQAVRDARSVLGPDVRLFADANQAWSVEEAVTMAKALRDAGVVWLEEPVAGDRLADLQVVAERSGLPLATGENVYGTQAFTDLAASGAVQIVQPDLTKCGGVTSYLAAAAAVEPFGLATNPHLYNGAVAVGSTIHVAMAVASTQLLEWDVRSNPLRTDVDHLLQDDGTVALPAGPGTGIELDLDRLTDLEESA